MKFYSINSKKLLINVVSAPVKSNYNIPVELPSIFRKLSPLEALLYFEIFYRAQQAKDRRRGLKVAHKLVEPDPMIIAIAYIMWEGIIQGLAWDVVKSLVLKNIASLKELIPITTSIKKKKSSSQLEIGVWFAKYTANEKKLYDMFIGLKRTTKKLDEKSKAAISKTDVATTNKKKR